MKYFYASIMWLACCDFAFSQIPNCNIPTPINTEIADIISPLDKSQVPTGILYESVFPWAELTTYDGSENTNTTSTLHFIQAYNEIYHSSFSRSSLIHTSELGTKLINFNTDPDFHHPIGIIDYNFNTINPDAVANNLLSTSNGKIYDVSGRNESPYDAQNVFIAVPLFAEGLDRFYTGSTHTFYLDSDFILSNNGFNLSDYEYIDFEMDGQLLHRESLLDLGNQQNGRSIKGPIRFFSFFIPFVTVTSFAILTIKLKKKIFGVKISRIELKKEDLKELTPCNGQTQIFVTGDSFNGGYGSGAYAAKGRGYIFFADNNCTSQQIKKLVIFVDGFDPTNSRKVWDIWDGRVNRKFQENGIDKRFGDELRQNGYDIAIYDYDEKGTNRGGAGFVENNGLAFAKFLETIYNQYQSSIQQDFIIIAPSMGALVARYALAYMEKNNKPHHTRTYISFDGPHQGAEVPLGVQQMLDMVTQYGGLHIFEGVRNFLHQNNGAKQMLVNHSSMGSEEIEPHPYRTQLLSNLNLVNNYPSICRKVAIVNGNRSGILKSQTQPDNEIITPCQQEFELEIIKNKNPVCTSNCDIVRIKAYTQTESNRCESLDFAVNNKTNLFKLVFGGGQFKQQKFYTLPFNNQSYDIAPGGNFGADADVDIEGDQIKGLNKILDKVTSKQLGVPLNLLPFTNFMPTMSSVDYTFPNSESYNIYKNFTGVNLTKCAGTTPFDTVYAPLDKDLGHARNDERLINAFRNEIYNLPNSICAGNCQDYITLNSTIPDNSTDIYRAGKAIKLEPNFFANGNSNIVFAAIIGCPQLQLYQPKPKVKSPNQISTICSLQPFEFDQAKNYKTCNGGNTTFHVFVHNIDINTYAEFSTDGITWYKANILDNGFEITLPNSTNALYFQARTADDRSRNISGYLDYCN
jgi:hypothetical protein